jgi:hypothetical protein
VVGGVMREMERLAHLRSWQLTAEIVGRGLPELFPMCLRSDDGQSDCLYLYDAQMIPRIIIDRRGSITTQEGRVLVYDEWTQRVADDAAGFAEEIGMDELGMWLCADETPDSRVAVACYSIAAVLENPEARALPIWHESIEGEDGFVQERLLALYEFADGILGDAQEMPPGEESPRFPAAAWLWAIELDGEPSRIFNIRHAVSYRMDDMIFNLSYP